MPTQPSRWRCDRRGCDGQPHDGWEWPHARANQLPPDGDWFCWLYMAGRGAGKLLDLDTPIPTPSGWRPLRSLALGDEVFDEGGSPCRITAVFDQMPERAWRLEFSDGTSLVAGGEHQWITWTQAARKAYNRSAYEERDGLPMDWPKWRSLQRWKGGPPRIRVGSLGPEVRSTDEIVRTLTWGARGDRNHSIPVARPLVLPTVDLPVDPYVLGYWLGDGSSASSDITISDADAAETTGRFRAAGFSVGTGRCRDPSAVCDTYPVGVKPPAWSSSGFTANGSLHSALKALNLLRNKHIPESYLWASEAQRLALLRGLMDSDGWAGNGRSVEFSSTREVLAVGVTQLARSLGSKPVLGKGRATLYGVDSGPKWRVTWRPTVHNPFLLKRKADTVRALGTQASRSYHRMIVGATPVPVRPMRCLTVDSPNSLFLAGDGMIPTHNTRTASEDIAEFCRRTPRARVALVAPTFGDVRDTQVEGESGLLSVLAPSDMRGGSVESAWNRSMGELYFSNGSRCRAFSSERPDRLRGPQHHRAAVDEAASLLDAGKGDAMGTTWNNLVLGLRLGNRPKVVVTTTPKPNKLMRDLLGRSSTVVVRGSTYDNLANLAPTFAAQVLDQYQGTRIGRQELEGELLEDVPGALWSRAMIDDARLVDAPEMARIVVAVDPAVTSGEDSDETGIIVAGKGIDGRGYVLADLSCRLSPDGWARRVVDAYHDWGADRVVAEVNQGGDLVERLLRTVDPTVSYRAVRASRGKRTRAEPVAALFEQRRISHIGSFPELEDQLCSFTPEGTAGGHDDRIDALVWSITDLMLGDRRKVRIVV